MKLLTVVGARPQFVKAATLSRVLDRDYPQVTQILVHTGQHYDPSMSEIFFNELGIPQPTHRLGVGGGSHGQNTGRMLEKLDALISQEKPDWVLTYGDTDSTLAGALAAAKLHVPIAHVEAGLRSFNRRMPEEVNRVLTDHMADLLLVPTTAASKNLLNEGISESKIRIIGDVMYDASLHYRGHAKKPSWFDVLKVENFILGTVHRAENTDDKERLRNIIEGFGQSNIPIILPLHPRTRKQLKALNLNMPQNVRIVDPVGYLEMIWLEAHCQFVVTDSGGVQKEAYFFLKPCITLRDETEWTELVDMGVNQLVGTDPELIRNAIHAACSISINNTALYGDGKAADKVAKLLIQANSHPCQNTVGR